MILSQSRPINRLAGDFGDILREMSDVTQLRSARSMFEGLAAKLAAV